MATNMASAVARCGHKWRMFAKRVMVLVPRCESSRRTGGRKSAWRVDFRQGFGGGSRNFGVRAGCGIRCSRRRHGEDGDKLRDGITGLAGSTGSIDEWV